MFISPSPSGSSPGLPWAMSYSGRCQLHVGAIFGESVTNELPAHEEMGETAGCS
jgi:hypothetical protein